MSKVGVVPGRLSVLIFSESLLAEEAPAGLRSLVLHRLLTEELILADQFFKFVDLLALLLFLIVEGGPAVFQFSLICTRVVTASLEAI